MSWFFFFILSLLLRYTYHTHDWHWVLSCDTLGRAPWRCFLLWDWRSLAVSLWQRLFTLLCLAESDGGCTLLPKHFQSPWTTARCQLSKFKHIWTGEVFVLGILVKIWSRCDFHSTLLCLARVTVYPVLLKKLLLPSPERFCQITCQ